MSSVVHKTITPTRLSASRDELSGLQSTMPSGRPFAYHERVSIALGLRTAGVLSKLYSETMEEVRPVEALRSLGASPVQVLLQQRPTRFLPSFDYAYPGDLRNGSCQ